MNKHANTIVALTALLAGAGHAAGLTASDSEGAKDAYRAELVSSGLAVAAADSPQISVNGQLQFRYMSVFDADDPATPAEEDFESGFESSRTRLKFKGSLPDQKLTAVVLANFSSSDGDFAIDDAYVDWDAGDGWKFRFGQFKQPFDREFYGISPFKVLLTEKSLTTAEFKVDRSQGVMAGYTSDRFRFNAAINDGRKAKNTSYTSSNEGDFGVSARAEFRLGEAGWKQFKDFTAFRGDSNGVLIGLGGHWQQDGQTDAPSGFGENANYFSYTADIGWEGNGFNLFGAFYGTYIESGEDSVNDFGFSVHGGFFVTEQNEFFARYSLVSPDSDRGANSDEFSHISFGFNHYIIPNSHAAKLTAEVGISPDSLQDSSAFVGSQSKLGILADGDGGQVAASLQLQILF